MASSLDTVRVVLFSGGRGSGVLSKQLLKAPHVQLTLAINGYDDGASTGEVRRFLGDSLGPSDFRKNASRLALELGTCPPSVIDTLDARLPDGLTRSEALAAIRRKTSPMRAIDARIDAFTCELESTGRAFDFNDCSVGNLVFAGAFLLAGRRFNAAVDDYCALVGLPPGVVENVTNGENAYLVAVGEDGRIFATEEEIVGVAGPNRIREIFLIDRPLSESDRARLASGGAAAAAAFFDARRVTTSLNPRLAAQLRIANLIVYAPGTQHSSLFPSYLTPGLSDAIAGNLGAIKLLITNIQSDAEIAGSSAVDIIGRAQFYLNDKGRRALPTPCLITHYVVNEPGLVDADIPYVPLGQIDTFEDPRLIRIANYEEGVTGRHDAAKILEPYVRSFVEKGKRQRIALLLHDAGSLNKITQTLIEMVRGGIATVDVSLVAFYEGAALDPAFVQSLPFELRCLAPGQRLADAAGTEPFDYVMLVESSGMYRGEDVVVLASHLSIGRLDAAWGSRRLSVRDIQESIRFLYSKTPLFGAISAVGSHLLSLGCLMFYGRYISDTLSGLRAVRAEDAFSITVPLTHKRANQYLLARLLRRRAEILEIPVRFFSISPYRVKRTSVFDGLQALATLVRGRWSPQPTVRRSVDAAGSDAASQQSAQGVATR